MAGKEGIVVVGAGASGLMAAVELAKRGNDVLILEARKRTGGRIWTLPKSRLGCVAEAGAEFVHGRAPVTRRIAREAGIALVPTHSELWSYYNGVLEKGYGWMPEQQELMERVKGLKQDMPVAAFLNRYFPGKRYAELRAAVLGMSEGYDAADPKRASMLSLANEVFTDDGEHLQYRIAGGYAALLGFLEGRCEKLGAAIRLGTIVKSIDVGEGRVRLSCQDGNEYFADKAIVTVPLPLIGRIRFRPGIGGRRYAVRRMGYGNAMKVLLKFRRRWWTACRGYDLDRLEFIRSDLPIRTWWTQYPDKVPLITGWLAGPGALGMARRSERQVVEIAVRSLSSIFDVDTERVRKELAGSMVVKWPLDPMSKGAYSYATVGYENARQKVAEPIGNRIFFAGEALYGGSSASTVEGAFASGIEAAKAVLDS